MYELLTDEELAGLRVDMDTVINVDECELFRNVDEEGTLLPNGFIVRDPHLTLYTGPCAMWPLLSRRDRFDEIAEGLVFTRQYRVTLPWSVDDIQIRDRFKVTVSDDPQLVNREMEVRDVIVESKIAVRRLTVHDFRE